MALAELKPLLTALVLPPAGPMLLMALGWWLGGRPPRLSSHPRWRDGPPDSHGRGSPHRVSHASQRLGQGMVALGFAALWLLSCHGVSLLLHRHLIGETPAINPKTIAAHHAQAIVVLGGGVQPLAPEYGQTALNGPSLQRLAYAADLAKQTGLPMVFSGGVGWAALGVQTHSEAMAAQLTVQRWGQTIAHLDHQSQDTAENAEQVKALLSPLNIKRIVLVTHASHIKRSLIQFQRQGFEPLAAPINQPQTTLRPHLAWLPSHTGLESSREALREWLGLWVLRWQLDSKT